MARAIEPGVLQVLRWFVVIRLSLLLLTWIVVQQNPDAAIPRFPVPGIIFMGVLLALLVWPDGGRRFGKAWLPAMLTIASVGPVVEHAITVAGRLEAGTTVSVAFGDYWQLFFVLFVPALLIAWQYRYRWVLLFAIGTTLLDLILTVPQLDPGDAQLQVLGGLAIARGAMYAFVGLFVVKLVAEQRESRAGLARHAAALEQLATSRERNRLARELHDTLAHSLSAVTVQLEAVRSLWDTDPEDARRTLDGSLDTAREGLGEARRAIQALRAAPLDDLGLAGALEALATTTTTRSTLKVTTDIADDIGVLDPAVEQVIYRIADEALNNAMRHSEAKTVRLTLANIGGIGRLEVSDDGTGFDPATPPTPGHLGLQSMRERTAMVGGTLDIVSAPGEGTTVRFEVETQ